MKKTRNNRDQDLIERTASIYHSIAHDSMDGFLILDMHGQFLDVNDVYCRMIGYSRGELLKMNLVDVEAAEKPQNVVKFMRHIKRLGKTRVFTQHRKKNGTIVEVEISVNYTNYLGGLVFATLRDITGIKKTENDQFRNRAESRKKMEGKLADSYRHSENQDQSRKVVEGQLADSYKHSKEEAESRKVIDGQLADSYRHSENQDQSRKIVEGQLADSYKYLGTINRKITLLLDIEKLPRSKSHRKETIDYILSLAMSIVNAPMGYLYSSKGRGTFSLLSYKGVEAGQEEKIKVITSRKVGLLKHLLREKSLISGDIKRYEAELLASDNKLEYFVTLPLSKGTALGGFIFLGFNKKHTVATQDLEFLDVFAMHASKALMEAGVLE
ncbi:MAG: PAS domain S-box protein [Candidatus Moranbacteria bacterium]|nr:PAS domain S-box protein [Candidatus Moranbacteria bacterium]